MNRQELRTQASRRLSVGRQFNDQDKAGIATAMDHILAPYVERDEKAQKAEPKQAPYNFEPKSVIWLERAVRQRLKL